MQAAYTLKPALQIAKISRLYLLIGCEKVHPQVDDPPARLATTDYIAVVVDEDEVPAFDSCDQ